MVQYYSDEPIGTVVIDTRNHYLYWIWENNTALRYGVGVGREGFQWFGRAKHRPQGALAALDAAAGNAQATAGIACLYGSGSG